MTFMAVIREVCAIPVKYPGRAGIEVNEVVNEPVLPHIAGDGLESVRRRAARSALQAQAKPCGIPDALLLNHQ